MAGSLPAGSEGSILSFLQGGTPEQKREIKQQSALDQLIGTIGQEPRAMTAIPGVPQTSRIPVPAFGDNPGVPGNFAPQDIDPARDTFKTKQLALLAQAAPQAMVSSLANSILPQAPSFQKFAPGETGGLVDPRTGKMTQTYAAPFKPEDDFKVGATREIQIGDQKHTQEYQGNRVWKDIASGAAFSPQQEPAPVEIDDPTSPTGRRLVSRAEGVGRPGPAQQSPQASANTLRDEFNKQIEPIKTVASMYRNGVKAAKTESGAGDMNLIYSFMKALDPGSSVKEGEYAQGENLTGAYGKFWQSYNKAKDGEKLLPQTRADILGQLKNIYTSHLPSFAAAKQRYTDIATRQRIKPEDVVTDLPSIDESSVLPGKAPIGKNGKPMVWVP